MRQFCDLVLKVMPIRPGTGVSKNSKRMHSYPKKASIDVCIEIKTDNSNGCQNGGMDTYFNQFGFKWLFHILAIVSHATGYDLVGFLTLQVLF